MQDPPVPTRQISQMSNITIDTLVIVLNQKLLFETGRRLSKTHSYSGAFKELDEIEATRRIDNLINVDAAKLPRLSLLRLMEYNVIWRDHVLERPCLAGTMSRRDHV